MHAPTNATLRDLLAATRTIAVVGLSDSPLRPSFSVAVYLKANGFRIIPVNPNLTEVLGEPARDSLAEIDEPVDIVNVFRRSEYCAAVAQEAVPLQPRALWLQLGIRNDDAMRIAHRAGLVAVQNRCIRIEHQRLLVRPPSPRSTGRQIGD